MVKDRFEEKRLLFLVQTKKDADAFAELYRRYIEKIYRFIFFKVGHRQTSEDIASDVFMKTWNYLIEGAEERAPVDSFSGFVYQVARNSIVDWYRSRGGADVPIDREANDMPLPAANDPALLYHDLERVYAAIRKLKHEYQEAVLLRYIEELSISEIVHITGRGHAAVRVTLHRAMKKLREMLKQ